MWRQHSEQFGGSKKIVVGYGTTRREVHRGKGGALVLSDEYENWKELYERGKCGKNQLHYVLVIDIFAKPIYLFLILASLSRLL